MGNILSKSPVFACGILVLIFDGVIPFVVGKVDNGAFLAVVLVDNRYVYGGTYCK